MSSLDPTGSLVCPRIPDKKENGWIFMLKLNHSISPLDNPSQIKVVRRTIARLATELRQREINQ